VHARGRVKAQDSGGFEFRIALKRGDEHHRLAGFLWCPPGDDEVEVRAGFPQGGQGIGQAAGLIVDRGRPHLDAFNNQIHDRSPLHSDRCGYSPTPVS
jgi:hypothetical protein